MKAGEIIVHIKIFFDFFKSEEKHAIKLLIVPIIAIGLNVEPKVRIAPILKHISPNVVV